MSKPVYVICRDFEVKTAVFAEMIHKNVISFVRNQKTFWRGKQWCIIGRYSTNRNTLIKIFQAVKKTGNLD
mgnify:FL=1